MLPPVSKLTQEQAMLWFIMGYTSKLAGTETGVTEPKTRLQPLLRRALHAPQPGRLRRACWARSWTSTAPQVYLINTGWSGGPYGVGSRMDIMLTRAMVAAAIDGTLKDVEYKQDEVFKVHVPDHLPRRGGRRASCSR